MARVHQQQDVTVIELDEACDALDSGPFDNMRHLMLGCAQSITPPLMVLDLTHTAYMGSAFIEVMFRTHKRLHERGGRLVLCGLQPLCAEVLRIARLDSIFETHPDVAAGVQALRAE